MKKQTLTLKVYTILLMRVRVACVLGIEEITKWNDVLVYMMINTRMTQCQLDRINDTEATKLI